jgi:hypothetical protein
MYKNWICLFVLIALAIAVRVYVGQSTGFQFDDAWITYRYAENLAAGRGFVYNDGEFVEGSTAPLFVLLLSVLRFAGFAIPQSSLAISLVATLGLLYVAWKICEPRIGTAGALMAVVILGFSPALIVASVSGMETTLFIALLLLASLAYFEERPLLLGCASAALVLIRIDGLLLFPAIVATELWIRFWQGPAPDGINRVRFISRSIAIAVILLLPWIAFSVYYFGDVLPNSIWAKLALYRHTELDMTASSMIIQGIFRLGNEAQPMLEIPVVVSCLIWTLAAARKEAILAIWFLGYAVFFLSGPVHMHPWYYTPFHAVAAILVVLCLGDWWRAVPWHGAQLRGIWRVAAIAFASMLIILGSLQSYARAATYQALYNSAQINVANYIASQSTAEDTVYAWDIGYIGAISGRRILDFVGIVSPEVIPYNEHRDYVGVLKTWRPKWAVVGYYGHIYHKITDDPWFHRSYVLAYRNSVSVSPGWSIDDPRRGTAYTWEYGVYRLVN